MIDHVSLSVSDFKRSRAFYDAALAPLGVAVRMEVGAEETDSGVAFAGYGRDRPVLWVAEGPQPTGHVHLALTASTRAEVDAFYEAAIAAGARDNGPPGVRPYYHPNYYGAFVIDPDGVNLEAVCHAPA
ncbi:MAG: VOC family protein [Caulobacteraceae bacterium]